MSLAWVALLLIYAMLFLIVVWPIHWMWHMLSRSGPYDRRFYRQRSFWRIYALVFGTAVVAMLLVALLRGRPLM
jgi:hypothetical protein